MLVHILAGFRGTPRAPRTALDARTQRHLCVAGARRLGIATRFQRENEAKERVAPYANIYGRSQYGGGSIG